MKRSQSRFGLLLCLLASGAAVELAAAAPVARVAEISGTVTLNRSNQPMADLKLNDAVQVGDEVITDLSSTAVLRLTDGSTVKVFPGSRVAFEDPGGSLKNFLHVLFGTVKLKIEKLAGRPNPKAVTTPTAIVAVRGTIFQVAVDQDETTGVEVEEGEVAVANRYVTGNEVVLRGGQESWIRRGMPPLPPQPRGTGPGSPNRARSGDNQPGPDGARSRTAAQGGPQRGSANPNPTRPVSAEPTRMPMPGPQVRPQSGSPRPQVSSPTQPSAPQQASRKKRN